MHEFRVGLLDVYAGEDGLYGVHLLSYETSAMSRAGLGVVWDSDRGALWVDVLWREFGPIWLP